MRSQHEQQDAVESSTYRELQLLSQVDENPDATQRQLSLQVGIALGLTNVLLRNLVQKGYVKVSKATWKRRLYTLTPDGFSRRIRLMVDYVHKVLGHYQGVRQTLREQLEPLALNEESRVAIYGTGEFAELVYLGLKELSIEEIDVFDFKATDGRRFLGMPVRHIETIQGDLYDRVIVAYLEQSPTVMAGLQNQGVSTDQLVKFFSDENN